MPCPFSFQCLLGKPTVILGAVASLLGAAVGIGGLSWLAENDLTGETSHLYTMMIISNSLSLTTFSVMLTVAFSCPNEKYANFFGFLQFAVGKGILMVFAAIIEIAFAILFAFLPGKYWVGILIYLCVGVMGLATVMVFMRSCCYENNQAIIMQARSSSSTTKSSAARGASHTRNSGSEFGGGRAKDYEAPPVPAAPARNEIAEDAFGADNPFS